MRNQHFLPVLTLKQLGNLQWKFLSFVLKIKIKTIREVDFFSIYCIRIFNNFSILLIQIMDKVYVGHPITFISAKIPFLIYTTLEVDFLKLLNTTIAILWLMNDA
jgi:hypothetical protein